MDASGYPPAMKSLSVGWVLYRRDILTALRTPTLYVILAFICLLLAFFLRNFFITISVLSVVVSQDPAALPFFLSVSALSLYLAVASSISICFERERRTLEVLFYGPVTAPIRIVSLFLRDLSLFVLGLAVVLLHLWIVSLGSNLPVGPHSLRSAARATLLVWPMIGFSLLISALVRHTRTAIVIVGGAFVLLAGLQAGYIVMSGLPAENLSLFMIYIRHALDLVLSIVQWLSPFAYIARISEGAAGGPELGAGWYLALAGGYGAGLLALAAWVLAKRDKQA